MRNSEIDNILAAREEIVPSSGFADSVMESVRREAFAPPTLRFPWKPAAMGLFAAAVMLVWLAAKSAEFLAPGSTQALASNTASFFDWALRAGQPYGASWIALALLLSFASVKLSSWLTAEE